MSRDYFRAGHYTLKHTKAWVHVSMRGHTRALQLTSTCYTKNTVK